MNQITDSYEQLKKLSRDELIAKARAAAKLGTRSVKEQCEESLTNFIRHAWSVVEPGAPYIHGWHVDAVCMHLEAIANGDINRLLINIPPGPGWVENLVTTERGRIRLGDLRVGDRVLTHRGRYRSVEACYSKGNLPTLRIITKGGRETIATPDHNFLTPDGWVAAKDLRVGDTLAFVTPQEDIAENKVSLAEARLLGYLVGDGGITHNVNFTNGDEDVVSDFEICAQSLGFTTAKTWRKTHWSVRINGGKPVVNWLDSHGLMGKSSYEKFIPNLILASSREAIQNFLGAYWSCDGMIEVRATRTRGSCYRASATTVSERLAKDLQHALSRVGIRANIRQKKRKLETQSQPGGVYRSFCIEVNQEADTAKFMNMPGLCSRKSKLASLCKKRRFDIVLNEDPIVLIEDAGTRECMCVSVEEDHSLIWDDIVVHNTMKSLATTVFFPAWMWGPKDQAYLRFLCASHSQSLAVRDSTKMRRLVQSEWYQGFWGDRVQLTGDQNSKLKFENTSFGFREAVAAGSITGSRGDYVLLDDPHSVEGAASEAMRNTTKDWFLEAVPTRLNNPRKSAIVVIMQRLHEEDVSGIILEKNLGYEHLMLPMEYEPDRKCSTSIGFEDPRSEEGELLFPKRFPQEVVERDKLVMGPYASAGQFQQSPTPRGGGIIKREWWQLWDDETANSQGLSSCDKYPPMDYIVASLDPAYTSKQENDPSALTIWGVWQKGGESARRILGRTGEVVDYIDDRDTVPCVMLMFAWAKRLPIHGPDVEKNPNETEAEFRLRQQQNWGLVEWIVDSCSKYNVDTLLIESKGSGISVSQEIQRLNRTLTWNVHLVNPGNADKVARAYAVQPAFSNGIIYAPDRAWADKVMTEAENFPKGKHDDLVDSTTQALKFMRERGLLRRPEEIVASIKGEVNAPKNSKPVYDV